VFAALTVNTILWILPLLVLALVKLVTPSVAARRFITRRLMNIAEGWIGVNAFIFGAVNDTRWETRGLDDLSRAEWYLVLPNHQSWVDIVVLQTLFNRRIPLLKFFIKKQLAWFPLLGVAFWALDMPFMQRHSKAHLARYPEQRDSDLEATRRACEKFRDTPTSVINFVEGTRFSEAKRDRRKSPYRNLLMPRAGGVALALSTMGEMFSAILDVTLYYPGGPPKFWDLVCGELGAVVVDVRRHPVEAWTTEGDYAGDRAFRRDFHGWLGAIWAEKDRRIEELRETAAPATPMA